MSHCDSQMSDQGNMMVPEGELDILWADRDPVGAPYMVGCASNGITAVCSFGPFGNDPFLKAYNGDGDVLWSYNGLGPLASISAPMIDDQGRVIACDARNIVMLDDQGSLLWKIELPGGIPISPVVTENGLVIVTTTSGWIYAVDPDTGTKLGNGLQFTDTIGNKKGIFSTRNTPTVQGNRIYSVNEFVPNMGQDPTRTGRVFAVDVTMDSNAPFQLAWTLDFGARSGGSPTLVDGILFFDGDNPAPGASRGEESPHFFGVQDMGTYGQYIFKTPIVDNVRASPAADPYGRGIWFSAEGSPFT
jgi:PQQ-like domain